MTSVRHVCQGGTAAELVGTIAGGNIVAICDDHAVGPLFDIDSRACQAHEDLRKGYARNETKRRFLQMAFCEIGAGGNPIARRRRFSRLAFGEPASSQRRRSRGIPLSNAHVDAA
jgi:hypothetical protein